MSPNVKSRACESCDVPISVRTCRPGGSGTAVQSTFATGKGTAAVVINPDAIEELDLTYHLHDHASEENGLRAYETTDGGVTWPEFAAPTDIPNPGATITLYQNAESAIALVHNPNPTPGQRRPLSLWVSYDDLQTWPHQQVLVPESLDGPDHPGMGLSYPDGFLSADGHTLHIAFDDNRHRAVYVRASVP